MTFRTPMLRRLAVLWVVAAMLVAATGCTALKNGDDKPDAGATGDLGADLGIAEWDQGPPVADQGVPPVDLGFYDDAGAADLGSADLGSADLGSADLGSADLGSADLGPADLGPADLGPADPSPPDLGPADMGFVCTSAPPHPSGDTRWPQYPLPGTPSHDRSYQITSTGGEETVIDCVTGLEWQRAVTADTYTQADAIRHCNGLTLAGSGWRLPSTIELMTLVDYAVLPPGPTIDVTAFPATPTEWFWSSSPIAYSAVYGWYVNFGDGTAMSVGADAAYRTRCVR